MKDVTPIRRQYLEIKSKHKDAILLFRIGDFYEAFDDDARILARELNILLTSKAMGKNARVPLAGVPHFVLEKHLATLISRGHRVAICEQTSSAPIKGADGKKLIQREVVRIVTAGTIIEPSLLQSKTNNYLCAFVSDGLRAGIAYADVTTGDFADTEESFDSQTDLPTFVTKLKPQYFEFQNARKTLFKHFNTKTLQPFGLE